MNRFVLIGAGRAGPSLAVGLQAAGWELVGCWSRTQERAERVASVLSTQAYWGDDGLAVAAGVPVVVVAVVDDAIIPLSRALATLVSEESVVLHTSGSVPSTALVESGIRGFCGSLHPLAALPDIVAVGVGPALHRLRGAFCAVEGDPHATALATTMAHAVGARPIAVETSGKTLYHGAAVLLSNYLVTLFDAATTMMERAGVERAQGRAMLFELARGALDNVASCEAHDALTGPVRRGDTTTVAAHLHALDAAHLDDIGDIYRALLGPTVGIALRAGIDRDVADTLMEMGTRSSDDRDA